MLVESGLNSVQVSLMRPIYILLLKQVVLIARVVLNLSVLYSKTVQYIKIKVGMYFYFQILKYEVKVVEAKTGDTFI